MSSPGAVPASPDSPVLVTGANGLVGGRTCARLLDLGVPVRALVRRAGTAPAGVEERVGDFTDPQEAAGAVAGARAVIATVHPMGSDEATQRSVGVEGTATLARAARDAGVARLIHVSTAAVYRREPGMDDVVEDGPLVGDDGGDYPVTKREAEETLAGIDGLTRVLLRPPAILGSGPTSVWNDLRPRAMREDHRQCTANPAGSWAWVHVDDLARFAASLAAGRIATADDPERGPVEGGCTPVSVAGVGGRQRDYFATVAEALDLSPRWTDEPVWTGSLATDRARGWGWRPEVTLEDALDELRSGLRR